MQKSGLLMAVGPVLMWIGVRLSSEIALFLFGTVHIISTPNRADYALANRITYTLLLAGLIIYIFGAILAVRERKLLNTGTYNHPVFYAINILLIIMGTIMFIFVLTFIVIVIMIGLNWR